MIRIAAATLCLGATIARAETTAIDVNGKFAFKWTRGHAVCKKVEGALGKKLKTYRCAPPDPDIGTASGKPLVAQCAAPKGRDEYLVFATLADCNEERETQAANGD